MVLAVNWPGQEPTRRRARPLQLGKLASRHGARQHRADALVGREHGDVAPAPAARQHGAAVDEHARAR